MRHTLHAVLSLALASCLLAGGASIASAQAVTPPPSGSGEVRGVVVDAAAGTPVGRASVAIRAKASNALVAGAIATPEGTFRIQGLRPGAYTARVTYLGYAPHLREVTITPSAPLVDLGRVALTKRAAQLEEVAITEDRETMSIEADRNAYRAKDVAPAAANASEVLDAVPSVQVDGDGKVSLRGNENVAVQINGRPSPLRGPQLASYLKGLPANIVERVEVIPNPSARHDPEGMAGIINIQLKENVDLGLSAGLNAGVSQADRYNTSGNVGYQSGPLSLFANAGVNRDSRNVDGINDRERIDALREPLSFTEQDIDGLNQFNGRNASLNVDYKLSARDLLSNAISGSYRTAGQASNSAYTELNGAREEQDRYDRLRRADEMGMTFDYSAALKRTFEARKHELTGEVRFTRHRDADENVLWRQSPGDLEGTTRVEGQVDYVNTTQRHYTAQVDYLRTLAPRTKVETGVKGIARRLGRSFVVEKDPTGTGEWTRSSLSNDFDFDEEISAVYVVASHGVRKFDLQGGLRGELASRDFSLAQPASSYPYTYRSLFPSAAAVYALSDATSLKASYSRRVRRPGTQELNPFPSFFDIQNVFLGNPNLNPEYTDAVELGLTRTMKRGSVQLSPFFRQTKDVIRVIVDPEAVVDGRDVTTVSFQNLATSNSFGSDLNGTLRLGPKLNGFASVNVYKMVTDGGTTSSLASNAVTWSSRLNASSQVTETLMLQGSYFYRAPVKIERGEFSATSMTTFSIRKKIDGDNSSLTLRVQDPFETMRFRIKVGDDKVVQLTERRFGGRTAFLTYQYAYGKPPRLREPRRDDQPQSGTPFP